MKHMEFKHKDVYVKVHTPLIITRLNEEKKKTELVYANVIDIDSRVQAVFAQFSHLRKAEDVYFSLTHAPRIGEKNYDKSSWSVRPAGGYKCQSQRENETLVSGLIVSEQILFRSGDGLTILAWDGNFEEKLFWAIEAHYETPMLQEWIPYIISQLKQDKLLTPLTVHDFTGDFPLLSAYDLLAPEEILEDYLSKGLVNGNIHLTENPVKGEN
ncbi:hypothetical protein [Paenibacillus sonchi]|uniref:hypothetical protein n=1 Tax=Paenibacillus sonchi TaxID=373687 RepID=UPI0005859C87|nr:hypothetical protein [Paenibacillus sonchi]